MARPRKRGLEYFPMDVDMNEDSAVAFIEAKHGLEGFAIVVRLLMRVYRDEGYFLRWDERESYVFAKSVGSTVDVVKGVIDDCLEEGLFNAKVFKKYGVLTSRGIQSRYIQATHRRSDVELAKEYLLAKELAASMSHVKVVSVTDNEVPADGTSTETPQSKGQDSTGQDNHIVEHVVTFLNEKVGSSYRASSGKTRRLIEARVAEGFALTDFQDVVTIKASQWLGTDMEKYLRPETLFGTKFEGYLNERKREGNGRAGVRRSGGFRNADALLGDGV